MGKFSELLGARLRRKSSEPVPNWSAIGDLLGLAIEIIELGPEQTRTRLLEARRKMGRAYENEVRRGLQLLRTSAEKQIEAADRALHLIDEASKRVDQEMVPRLVTS